MNSNYLSAIVLAAGTSSRMGNKNKLLLPWGNKTVIAKVVDSILASEAREVIVVLGHQAAAIQKALGERKLHYVLNPHYEQGMTSSIQTGLSVLSPDSQGFMVCLSDLPLLEGKELDILIHFFQNQYPSDPQLMVAPVFEGKKGHPMLFARSYLPEIMAHPEPEGCRGIVQAHKQHLKVLEMPNSHILQDIDTPLAYQQVQKNPKGSTD